MLIKSKSHGFTLIEIMIAMVIGLIVTAAAIAMYSSAIRGSTATVRTAKLSDELSYVMLLMSNDIRRAGYTGAAKADGTYDPRIHNAFNEITINDPANNCILYSYDEDASSTTSSPNQSAGEYFGFRLNSNEIQIWTGDAAADCASTSSSWISITDSDEINVTDLDFCMSGSRWKNVNDTDVFDTQTACIQTDITAATTGVDSGDDIVEVRQVTITIEAEHATDSDIKIGNPNDFSQTVRIRNNRAYTVP